MTHDTPLRKFLNRILQRPATTRANRRLRRSVNTVECLENRVLLSALSVGDVEQSEDSGTISFEVVLDEPITEDVTFDYTTVADTATAGTDFVSASGSGTIVAGQTQTVIAIDIVADTAVELDEQFFVELSNIDANGTPIEISGGGGGVSIKSLGSYDTDGSGYDVKVIGDIAYVADGDQGLKTLDISDLENITLLGAIDTPGYAYHIDVVDNVAYITDNYSGLQIFDVSDPANPSQLSTYNTSGRAFGIKVINNLAYVTDYADGLKILDVSDPSAPTLLGTYDTPGSAVGIQIIDDIAYLTDYREGLQILDVSDPANITSLGSFKTVNSATEVQVIDDVAYVSVYLDGLQILDVSDPTNITSLGTRDTPGFALDLVVIDDLAYIADYTSGLQVLNVSDPANITVEGSHNTNGKTRSIQIIGSTAYFADDSEGIHILSVGPSGIQTTGTIANDDHAPVNTVPGTQTINEDTPLAFSLNTNNGISIADADAASTDLQVTIEATNGTVTVGETTATSVTLTDTLQNLNAALAQLVFTPNEDFYGSASLTITTDDLTRTSIEGALTDVDSIAIEVTAVNDSPINQIPGPQSTKYETALVFSTANNNTISVSDPEAVADSTDVQVTVQVENGTLSLPTTGGLDFLVGDGTDDTTFTITGQINDINTALNGLTYTPEAEFYGDGSLTITTDDQHANGGPALTSTDTVRITVKPPVLEQPLGKIVDTPVAETNINGEFKKVVSGNFDGQAQLADALDDLFFWDPETGRNRIVFGDGTMQDTPIDPKYINGQDFLDVIAADLDSGDGDDLLFWNPISGRNRIAHLSGDNGSNYVIASVETNVIDPQQIDQQGDQFDQVVAGDFNNAGPEDLFFWNTYTGSNLLVHLESVTPGTDTNVTTIESDIVTPTMINGDDFTEVQVGQFQEGGVVELLFVNLSTGKNRLIELSAVTPGQNTDFAAMTDSLITAGSINGDVYSKWTAGDFNNDGLTDVFVWNPATGANRLLLTSEESPVSTEIVDNTIDPTEINQNGFQIVTPQTIDVGEGIFADSLFFWNPVTGQNRVGFGSRHSEV
ncbi:Calx-beta domain-containing protein [Thalassoroseus pseudoceratinae]|uniref:Calx-beta domain-containing protein n=1 Tax=Thalassoroseus pseudoceratinae TaxID=2713176 RepID=UPI00141EE287|nr:Calx-beta domain-containing protein [Thalassoroseus pseudoceratinae]